MSPPPAFLDEALSGSSPELRPIARHLLRPCPGSLGAAPATLVHGAYLGPRERRHPWRGREHRLSVAAVAMRRILRRPETRESA